MGWRVIQVCDRCGADSEKTLDAHAAGSPIVPFDGARLKFLTENEREPAVVCRDCLVSLEKWYKDHIMTPEPPHGPFR